MEIGHEFKNLIGSREDLFLKTAVEFVFRNAGRQMGRRD